MFEGRFPFSAAPRWREGARHLQRSLAVGLGLHRQIRPTRGGHRSHRGVRPRGVGHPSDLKKHVPLVRTALFEPILDKTQISALMFQVEGANHTDQIM